MYRLGIDVGGTNTDAVLFDESLNIKAFTKTATTEDVQSGIESAIASVLEKSGIDPAEITWAMLGTTQCTNAIVERKHLMDVAVLRIGAPAMVGIQPMIDWPEELKFFVKEQRIVKGGYEHDGKEIMPLDEEAVRQFFLEIKGKIKAIAISCVFSPVRKEHEEICSRIASEILGEDVYVSLSSEIGSLSFIERENATILNAALHQVAEYFTTGFDASLKKYGVNNAAQYISQNDGTLMSIELTRQYPIFTISSGPTNSIRGGTYLSKIENAIVIDVGGTTMDIGVVQKGFPRESNVAATIGDVRTNFRMPDVVSVGLGGGSIVRENEGKITVGPDSVGYQIHTQAMIFGGKIMTATDIAVRLGMADIGDPKLVADIPLETAEAAMAVMRKMVEDNVDKMKLSQEEVNIILVGGGSIIVPKDLVGATEVFEPEHAQVANAIGSAISRVSGNYEKVVSYDEIPREQSMEAAKSEAIAKAVQAGAKVESVEIIEVDEVPLAYFAGNSVRLKIKAAGDLG